MRVEFSELKALVREAFDDEGAKKKARISSSLGAVMIKGDRHAYFNKKGHKQDLIDEMESLFNEWGLGGRAQENARERILYEIDNNTALGRVIREHADMETSVFEEWIAGKEDRAERRFQELKRDLADGMIYMYGNHYTKRDIDDGTITIDDIREFALYDEGNPGMLYRAGKTGARMESWTTNPGGAVINNVTGRTFSGKQTEKHWNDLKREGYSILAGPMRMMGSPGESEVTIVKLDG